MSFYIYSDERNSRSTICLNGLYFYLIEEDPNNPYPTHQDFFALYGFHLVHGWDVEVYNGEFKDICNLLESNGIRKTDERKIPDVFRSVKQRAEFFIPNDDGNAKKAVEIIDNFFAYNTFESLKQKVSNLERKIRQFSDVENILEKEKKLNLREQELEDKKIELENKKSPTALKLSDIKDFFSSWTWVWLIVLFFSLVECSDRGMKNDLADEREAILHNESKKVEQKNKIIKRLEQQLKQSNDKLSKLKQPKKEVKTKVLTKLDSKHLKPLTKKEVSNKYYYNNRHCKRASIYSSGGTYGFLSSCSGVENSKNFNVATSICDFKKGTVIFGFYEPADSKRKGKAYVMRVLHDPKSLYGEGYEGTIWFTRETCLLYKILD